MTGHTNLISCFTDPPVQKKLNSKKKLINFFLNGGERSRDQSGQLALHLFSFIMLHNIDDGVIGRI